LKFASIPGTCGGLWDNLKQFPDCIGVGLETCEANENGDLFWTFSNGSGCNEGMVEATWFDATQNQWGSLECEEVCASEKVHIRLLTRLFKKA
jgi:hypothetical protein